ncbi:leucyl/phenylalanyl-tRNA--protein transferase [Aquisalimonas asiatica]|uniref:Leucyl/phenylalanyl-tRNA--protein transferase n=1 Tax=Aquisalimonas asiatica TaxID=406100 RepID=A0A1H8QBA3_9GAMM|nr:leucyl/phenylalanyl-tRNA--protein transferase [Aquisalimonas asiatica]SEO51281.1 leucyl/phenylalanyl-tRNA--protein transferase [Aquisalimonas asiatica]
MQRRIHWLDDAEETEFPSPHLALTRPNGLVAIGGNLSERRLLAAYRRGIFPWFEDDQPALWWSPDPRGVLYPDSLHVGRSLRKRLRNSGFSVTLDTAFVDVITACAAPRGLETGTWITQDMHDAYCHLHERGIAHSVEVWHHMRLVGGLYGVSLGRAFFGESMFSRSPDASKIALVMLTRQLQRWGFHFLDCQIMSPHLATLGAVEQPRARFLDELADALEYPDRRGPWEFDDAAPERQEPDRS